MDRHEYPDALPVLEIICVKISFFLSIRLSKMYKMHVKLLRVGSTQISESFPKIAFSQVDEFFRIFQNVLC